MRKESSYIHRRYKTNTLSSVWSSLGCLLLHLVVFLQPLGHTLSHLDVLVHTVHAAVHLVCVRVCVCACVCVCVCVCVTVALTTEFTIT